MPAFRLHAASMLGLRGLVVFMIAAPVAAGQAPAPVVPSATPAPAGSAEHARAVDEMFRQWHSPDSPGAAVLVIDRGRVVHARGYGMANLEHGVPIRPGTVFDIASVSKQDRRPNCWRCWHVLPPMPLSSATATRTGNTSASP